MKKKILLCISNNLFIRNYISTNLVTNLSKQYQIDIAVDEQNVEKIKIKKFLGKIFHLKYSSLERKNFDSYVLKYQFKYYKRSTSVKALVERFFFNSFEKFNKNLFINLLVNIKKLLTFIKYFTFYSLLNFNIKKKKGLYNNKIIKIFEKNNYNLVIVPSQGHSILDHDIECASNYFSVKTLKITDNWDNTSSRIHPKPLSKYYAVWGEQSKKLAIKTQKIDKKKIFILGSPRHEIYFKKVRSKSKNYFNFPYLLFLEAIRMKENLYELFYKIDAILEKEQYRSKNFKMVFRPHPWRKQQEFINIKNFKNIILDPQLEKQYNNKTLSTKLQPNLNYYPSLLKNSELIISGPTTMVIESSIFRKNLILLTHGKSQKFGNYYYYKNYEHFKDIKKLKNISICEDLNDLEKLVEISLQKKIKKNSNNNLLKYFLYYDFKKSFYLRLSSIIEKLI